MTNSVWGSFGANSPTREMFATETFATLRALTAPKATANVTIEVDGGVIKGDGLGGIFIWNASDNRVDNGTTIIQPDSLPAAGRWNIISVNSSANVLRFGADPTGLVDSAAAFTLAFATNKDIFVPAGIYKIGSTVIAPARFGFRLYGELRQTSLVGSFAGRILQLSTGGFGRKYIRIENIIFDASGAGISAATGIGGNANLSYVDSAEIVNCTFHGRLRYGIDLNPLLVTVKRCEFGTQVGAGAGIFKPMRLKGSDSFASMSKIIDCEITSGNDDYVVEINWANAIKVTGCTIEGNAPSVAVFGLIDVLGFTFNRSWAEVNGAVPLIKHMDGAHAPVDTRSVIDDNYIAGNNAGVNDVVLDVSTATGVKSVITNNIMSNFTHIILFAGGVYNIPGSQVNQVLAFWNNKIFGGTPGFLGLSDYGGGLTQYFGTQTNDDAPAGFIGEVIAATLGTGAATALVTGTGKTIISVNLTPGDWDVTGMIGFQPAGTTNITQLEGSISLVNNTIGNTDDSRTSNIGIPGAGYVPGNINIRFPVPVVRIKLVALTTVYLTALAAFTVAGLSSYGTIRARRVR